MTAYARFTAFAEIDVYRISSCRHSGPKAVASAQWCDALLR